MAIIFLIIFNRYQKLPLFYYILNNFKIIIISLILFNLTKIVKYLNNFKIKNLSIINEKLS